MTERVVSGLGGIDILVNNAAVYHRKPWTEITEADWDQVLDTNLKGYYLCARAAYPALKASGRGRVINVASITFFGGVPFLLDYVASKGGIVGFTRALARRWADGITVNTLSPGPSRPMPRRFIPISRTTIGRSSPPRASSDGELPRTSASGDVPGRRRGVVHHRPADSDRRRVDDAQEGVARSRCGAQGRETDEGPIVAPSPPEASAAPPP